MSYQLGYEHLYFFHHAFPGFKCMSYQLGYEQ